MQPQTPVYPSFLCPLSTFFFPLTLTNRQTVPFTAIAPNINRILPRLQSDSQPEELLPKHSKQSVNMETGTKAEVQETKAEDWDSSMSREPRKTAETVSMPYIVRRHVKLGVCELSQGDVTFGVIKQTGVSQGWILLNRHAILYRIPDQSFLWTHFHSIIRASSSTKPNTVTLQSCMTSLVRLWRRGRRIIREHPIGAKEQGEANGTGHVWCLGTVWVTVCHACEDCLVPFTACI